MKNVANNFNP